jgi:hypothetical protein
MMLRYLKRYYDINYIVEPTAMFRLHHGSKTVAHKNNFDFELLKVYNKIENDAESPEILRKIKKIKIRVWLRININFFTLHAIVISKLNKVIRLVRAD